MRRKPGSIVPLERDILEAAVILRGRGLVEAHGFLLAKTIGDGADAKRLTSYGTLYKALDRLERAGYLESRGRLPTTRPRPLVPAAASIASRGWANAPSRRPEPPILWPSAARRPPEPG